MSEKIITVLAFDYGTKKIGIAIGESLTRVAKPLGIINVKSGIPDWRQISSIMQAYHVDLAVVGLPLNMDGSRQPITKLAEEFAQQLTLHTEVTVELVDERLSSVAAKSLVFAEKKPGKRNKLKQRGLVDAYAAKVILDHWFNQ